MSCIQCQVACVCILFQHVFNYSTRSCRWQCNEQLGRYACVFAIFGHAWPNGLFAAFPCAAFVFAQQTCVVQRTAIDIFGQKSSLLEFVKSETPNLSFQVGKTWIFMSLRKKRMYHWIFGWYCKRMVGLMCGLVDGNPGGTPSPSSGGHLSKPTGPLKHGLNRLRTPAESTTFPAIPPASRS